MLHRGLDLALGFGDARTLAEEIGVTAEFPGCRQSDRVDTRVSGKQKRRLRRCLGDSEASA